jgi:microcystin-dependent protein
VFDMPLGVRGFNPIWVEFDLQGQLFDDTFYLFVLQNTIPYTPLPVYHDINLSDPWTNPIQFLANGTLPVDIYFVPDVVYRLEFRQGNTQAAPLVYEVDNYMPTGGESPPIDMTEFSTSNQVTNPQFALVNFSSPLTISGTDPAPIQIGPGWFLNLGGTGSVTLNQIALNNSNMNPSNAPYALELNLSGWDAGEVYLSQRFEQNGMLWANKTVSTTITAQLVGVSNTISATLFDSQGATLAEVLSPQIIDESWNEYTGYGVLPATTNSNTPPNAYIEYRLMLPSNINIYVTSIQLIVQDEPFTPAFEQDSINRQIDHTYNTAYPIMSVGGIIDFAGFVVPAHYLLCDGTAYSRITYNLLYQALTMTLTVTLTSTSNMFTVSSAALLRIGMFIEGTGIPAATTISNISGTTITMSAAATASGTVPVRFFGYANGDGSTTFNVPNLQDFVTAGLGGSLFGATLNGVGGSGGAATVTLTGANMPNTVGVCVTTNGANQTYQSGSTGNVFGTTSGLGNFNKGLGNAVSIVQQTALMMKCIRFE